mgnify:CR=1 FL=1
MSQVEVLKEKMKGLLDETKLLQKAKADGSLTDEQRDRAVTLASEIKSVGDELQRYTQSETAFGELASLAAFVGAQPAKKVPGVTDGGIDPTEARKREDYEGSWAQFRATEGWKRVAATGEGSSGSFPIRLKRQGMDAALKRGDLSPDELKTLIYTGATASLIQDQRLSGIVRGDSYERRVREALTGTLTDSTAVSFVRELVVTNSTAGFGEATTAGASPGPNTADFPESAITFEVASASVKSIGHMLPVTREMMDDVAGFDSYVSARAEEMLDDKVDTQLLTGAGSADLTGIYNTSGITDLDAAYFSANPVKSAGEPAENLGRIRRARTYHMVTNKARASHVLIHPYDLEDLAETRDADGNYLFPNGIPTFGLTWVESESATQGSPIVLDRRHWLVADKMENTAIISDSNREFFEFRILTLAVWTRLALVPLRPAAAAKVTFA